MAFIQSPVIAPKEYTLSYEAFQRDRGQAENIFHEFGFLCVSDALVGDPAFESYRDNLKKIILSKINQLELPFEPTDSIDQLFNRLCDHDRKIGANIYDVAREVEGFLELVRHPIIIEICRFLLRVDVLHIPFDKAMFRIDRPNERWSEFHWHQDYTYNVMSRPTATMWSPLTDVTLDMGALTIIPKSHGRFCPVVLKNKPALNGISSNKAAHIKQYTPEEMDGWAMKVPLKQGDVLFFHQNLIHRSGHNQSNRSRWVFTGRYGNALDRDLVGRDWKIERSSNFSMLAEVEKGSVTKMGYNEKDDSHG